MGRRWLRLEADAEDSGSSDPCGAPSTAGEPIRPPEGLAGPAGGPCAGVRRRGARGLAAPCAAAALAAAVLALCRPAAAWLPRAGLERAHPRQGREEAAVVLEQDVHQGEANPEEVAKARVANPKFEQLVYRFAFEDHSNQVSAESGAELGTTSVSETTDPAKRLAWSISDIFTRSDDDDDGDAHDDNEEEVSDDIYVYVGDGWCRPANCSWADLDCRVNGYFRDDTSKDECMGMCNSLEHCFGFAASSEKTLVYPKRCYIHDSHSAAGFEGWEAYDQSYYDIGTSTELDGVGCYKKDAPESTDDPTPAPTDEAQTPAPTAAPTKAPDPAPAPTSPAPAPAHAPQAKVEAPDSRCPAEKAMLRAPGVCPEGSPGAFEVTSVGLRTRSWDADEQLLADLRRYMDYMQSQGDWPEDLARSFASARTCLEKLVHVDAKDVLALQETWTDADTDVLRRLDPHADGFVEGELDTEAFRLRLPSAAQFADVVQERTLAMVGASRSLLESRPGPEIDAHEAVVRFNDHIGDNLDEAVTGTKTTVHVSCDAAGPMGDDGVAEFDLETRAPWNSYCHKMRIDGNPNTTYYIMRPTALCAMENDFSLFTRGFLFYWLVGRLFDHPDLYGFDGDGHYDRDDVVWESFLHFEHAVYRLARGELEIPTEREVVPSEHEVPTAT